MFIGVFKQSNCGLRKYLLLVYFAVSELSLASRKSLYVWPLTTHKLLVQVSRFVNASKNPTIKVKRKTLFARTPFYCCNFWGTQNRDKSTWTMKQVCSFDLDIYNLLGPINNNLRYFVAKSVCRKLRVLRCKIFCPKFLSV